MKKILTLATMVAGFGFSTSAQTIADLELTATLPVGTQDAPFNVPCKDSFNIAFKIVNNGPGTIGVNDTVFYYMPLTPDGQVHFRKPQAPIPMGGTVLNFSFKIHRSQLVRLVDLAAGDWTFEAPFADGTYGLPLIAAGFSTDTTILKDDNSQNNAAIPIIQINCPVGINGLTKNNSTLKVFPNPAYNQISFTNDFTTATNASVRITDIAGRVVKTKDLGKQNAGIKTYNIDIADLNNGMYYLELVTEDSRSISKFTKN